MDLLLGPAEVQRPLAGSVKCADVSHFLLEVKFNS